MRLVALVAMFVCLAAPALAEPVTHVAQGALQGAVEDGIAVFRGIPYAAPPVGPLRWRPPEPARDWRGIRNAAAFGPACMQAPGGNSMERTPTGESEDCLTLNVWTPDTGAKNLPVMVWIHGGAFKWGSSAVPLYDGTDLARHGVVVVTLNYRLGLFGFFGLSQVKGESPSGNYGLMDQIAALKWVKANIAAFGGDPANVTVFGESAGAMSVNDLMVSPPARGLFAKAIAESGLGFNRIRSTVEADETAASVAARHGIALNAPGAMAKLRALPAGDLAADEKGPGAPDVSPMVDGTILPGQVSVLFAQGSAAKVPYLTGWNSNEASLLKSPEGAEVAAGASYSIRRAAARGVFEREGKLSDADFADQFFNDDVFGAGAEGLASFAGRNGAPVYVYQFGYVAANFRNHFTGVIHGGELPYVFGTRGLELPFFVRLVTGGVSGADQKVVAMVQSYWTNFARTGDPNAAGLAPWPPFLPGHRTLVIGNDGPRAVAGFHRDRISVGFEAWSRSTGLAVPD